MTSPHKLLIVTLLLSINFSYSQKKKTETPTPEITNLKALKWRNIGPFRGGRANAIAGDISNDRLFYAGYTGGGVWKTEDGGQNWKNISDGFFGTSSIGDIAVSESDPNVIYVGTGEHALRGVMSTYGDGVYKSTDGGKTWQNVGLKDTRHISDVIIDPKNSDIVYVAAQGSPYASNEHKGVYKSTDGGKTWRKTLFINQETGISSLSMDMNNPRILYAGSWENHRKPWFVGSGGPSSGIYKSTDGGETWQKSSDGLPDVVGKIGLSVSPANSNRVYAIVEADKSKAGLYRSDNGGKTWTMTSNDQTITSRSWYYMEVFADPKDENKVYVLNSPMMKSTDGGRTFSNIPIGHVDTHDLWINPKDPKILGLADDGGAEITYNEAKSWSSLYNQPTAQFYRVSVDNLFPYNIYAGQQDNNSVKIASRTNSGGITDKDWSNSVGCENATIAFDPNNPEILFGTCYQGNISRLDTRTNETKDIQQFPSLNLGVTPSEMKYRHNWNAPLFVSQFDTKNLYHGANVVFKTTDGGINWKTISPDLTRNDKTKQTISGGPLTNEGAGGENYNTINYMMESYKNKGEIWTASDDGMVYLTKNDGETWENITPKNLPESLIHSLEVSPHNDGTAYICATRFKFNDLQSYTFKTTDYGKTWTRISNGVDADDFIKVIREDKKVPGLLYAGSERGFYLSKNGGSSWQKFQNNLPVVPITDIKIKDNDLVVSTAGRAFWILDDISVLQQGALNSNNELQIFAPTKTIRFSGGAYESAGSGTNPPSGVVLNYVLPEKATINNPATLKIYNNKNEVIRTFTSTKDENFKSYSGGPSAATLLPSEQGLNRFAYNMRVENIKPDIPGVYVMTSYDGYRLPPGNYKAEIAFKDKKSETNFEIIDHPKNNFSAQDWQAYEDFQKKVSAEISEIHTAVNIERKIKKQIEGYNELLKDQEQQKSLVEKGRTLIKKLEDWELTVTENRQKNFQDVLHWPSKLNADLMNLKSIGDDSDPRITGGMKDKYEALHSEWLKAKAELQNKIYKEVDDYVAAYKSANIPVIVK